MDTETRELQDECWDDGYFSVREGKPRTPPEKCQYPNHWLIGYDAATEDRANKGRS